MWKNGELRQQEWCVLRFLGLRFGFLALDPATVSVEILFSVEVGDGHGEVGLLYDEDLLSISHELRLASCDLECGCGVSRLNYLRIQRVKLGGAGLVFVPQLSCFVYVGRVQAAVVFLNKFGHFSRCVHSDDECGLTPFSLLAVIISGRPYSDQGDRERLLRVPDRLQRLAQGACVESFLPQKPQHSPPPASRSQGSPDSESWLQWPFPGSSSCA